MPCTKVKNSSFSQTTGKRRTYSFMAVKILILSFETPVSLQVPGSTESAEKRWTRTVYNSRVKPFNYIWLAVTPNRQCHSAVWLVQGPRLIAHFGHVCFPWRTSVWRRLVVAFPTVQLSNLRANTGQLINSVREGLRFFRKNPSALQFQHHSNLEWSLSLVRKYCPLELRTRITSSLASFHRTG